MTLSEKKLTLKNVELEIQLAVMTSEMLAMKHRELVARRASLATEIKAEEEANDEA